jgi:hypothetical protein
LGGCKVRKVIGYEAEKLGSWEAGKLCDGEVRKLGRLVLNV